MARSKLPATSDGLTLERATVVLGYRGVAPLARAVFERAGEAAIGPCGRDAAVVASLRVAADRSGRNEVGLEVACDALDVDPSDAARAEEVVESELSPPASAAEVRSLRRSIVAAHELLAGIENDRVNAPRLSGAPFDGVDPVLAALADRPLRDVDEAELRAHLERLEADFEMARMGVELYALAHGET